MSIVSPSGFRVEGLSPKRHCEPVGQAAASRAVRVLAYPCDLPVCTEPTEATKWPLVVLSLVS